MKTRLFIKVSFDSSVSYYVGKYLEIDGSIAKEKKINPGTHEVGVLRETKEAIKINYRGSTIWLPKENVKVLSVEEKDIFDFEEWKE